MAQTAPSPATTAIGWPFSRTARIFPVARSRRRSLDCSLHATQAALRSRASVIVGQYGPAAAHVGYGCAPGRAPATAAASVANHMAGSWRNVALSLGQRSLGSGHGC